MSIMFYPVVIVVGHVPWWAPLMAILGPVVVLLLGTALEELFGSIGRGLDLLHSKLALRKAKRRSRGGLGYWLGFSFGWVGHRAFGCRWTKIDRSSPPRQRRPYRGLSYWIGFGLGRLVRSIRRRIRRAELTGGGSRALV